VAIADANSWIATHQAQIDAANTNIESLNKDLQTALKARADYERALAEATREGLTGEAAEIRAKAIMANKKVLYIGLTISAVALVIALIWLYLKNRKAV
jgi:hypothetical protein